MAKHLLQHLHAKEYAGSWKNPLFSDPKAHERALGRTHILFYSLLVGICGITCSVLLFWFGVQDKFAITDIQVSGMRSVANEKLVYEAWQRLVECNALLAPCLFAWNVPHEDMLAQFKKKYTLEQASSKIEGSTLFINVQEAVTLIPLRIDAAIWFASKDGVLQKEATAEDISAGILIPPEVYSEIDVSAVTDTDPSVGLQIATPQIFSDIAAYRESFLEQGITVASFTLTDDPGKIIATTTQGFVVFFTPWEDASMQARRLGEVLQEATPQSYIDIRFGKRIYIK